jgi:hypothetical protein
MLRGWLRNISLLLTLRGGHVAQAAKPADEAKPRPVRKKRTPDDAWQAKQAWQPALRAA